MKARQARAQGVGRVHLFHAAPPTDNPVALFATPSWTRGQPSHACPPTAAILYSRCSTTRPRPRNPIALGTESPKDLTSATPDATPCLQTLEPSPWHAIPTNPPSTSSRAKPAMRSLRPRNPSARRCASRSLNQVGWAPRMPAVLRALADGQQTLATRTCARRSTPYNMSSNHSSRSVR